MVNCYKQYDGVMVSLQIEDEEKPIEGTAQVAEDGITVDGHEPVPFGKVESITPTSIVRSSAEEVE